MKFSPKLQIRTYEKFPENGNGILPKENFTDPHIIFSLKKLGGSVNPKQKLCLKLVYESFQGLTNGIFKKKSTQVVN